MAGATRPGQRLLPVTVVLVLLAVAMFAAAFGNPDVQLLPADIGSPADRGTPQPKASAAGEPTASAQDQPTTDGGASFPVAAGVAFLIIVAVVGAIGWRLHRGRSGAQITAIEPAEVRRRLWTAVDHGLESLAETDADPRRAVIACWTSLEVAAAAAGTPRQPGDTSTDLVVRLLAAHDVGAEVLVDFAEVYRWARYGTHPVDEAMRDRARLALGLLRDALAPEAAR